MASNSQNTIQYTAITGRIIKETDAALLFKYSGDNTSYWFPLSQVQSIHRDIFSEESGLYHDTVKVANWILNKKGIVV